MRGGELRHRVEVQQSVRTRDAHGGPMMSWTTLGTRWAKLEVVSATEYRNAQVAGAAITHRATLRYMAELDGVGASGCRLIWRSRDDRVLNVVTTRDPTGKKIMLELDCLEAV